MYIAASADKSSDVLGTKINPQTQNPLLKLFIQGGSACQYALNVIITASVLILPQVYKKQRKKTKKNPPSVIRKKAFNNR